MTQNHRSALVAVALCALTCHAAILPQQDRFTFLGSRSEYDSLKKEFIESNYYASAASGIWTQSADDCLKTFGSAGALVSIETESEQDAINLWLQERGSGGAIFWTSGLYEIEEGVWRWSGNENYTLSTYTNWANNTDPVSPNGRQRIGLNHQNRFSASWMSFDDTNLERYICELKSAENVGTGATDAPTTTAPTTTTPTTTTPTTTTPTTTTPTTTTPSPTLPVKCSVTNDLVISIGSAGDKTDGTDQSHFLELKEVAAQIAGAFVDHDPSRTSIVTYSEILTVLVDLDTSLNSDQIAAAIRGAEFIGGPHTANIALTHSTAALAGSASGVPKTILIITDAVSNSPDKTAAAAAAANAAGIRTFALGVSGASGSAEYKAELALIAGNDPTHLFYADWTDLSAILRDLTLALCP